MASTNNKVRFGASRVMYALEDDNGDLQSTWYPLAGAVQIGFTPQNDSNTFYADNSGYYITTGAASDEFSIELADMTDQAKQDLLGFIEENTSGLYVEPVNAKHKTFAMGYQVEGDGHTLRGVKYGCTLNRPSEEHNTTTDSTDPDTLTLEGSAIGKTFEIDGEPVPVLGAYCTDGGTSHDAFDNFYEGCPIPGSSPGTSASSVALSEFAIANVVLDPEFTSGVTTYTGVTTSASGSITATAADNEADVSITVNGSSATTSASFTAGKNLVTVLVTNGTAARLYTFTITKS